MSVLFKLLPAAAVGLVALANSGELKKSLNVISKVQVAATAGIEMQAIADAVAMEYTSEEKLPLDDFGKFLRENLREKGGKSTREHDKDMWGTPYRLAVKGEGFEVLSAGLDKEWNTADDLRCFYSLKELGGPGAPIPAPASPKAAKAAPSPASPAVPKAFPPPANTAAADEAKQKAFESQMKRAEQGSPYAQYELGMRYIKGNGVEKDVATGRSWLEEAVRNGSTDAARSLKSLDAAKP